MAYNVRIASAIIGSLTRSPLLIGNMVETFAGVRRTKPSIRISRTTKSSAAYACCTAAIALTSAKGIKKCVCRMPVFPVSYKSIYVYKRIKSLNKAKSIILPSSTIPIFKPNICICSETGFPRIASIM